MESNGFKVFLDKLDILPGHNIWHELAKGIEEANGIIVVHSKRYSESKWCDQEYQLAVRKDKAILPICRITDKYHSIEDMAFGSICWVDFTNDDYKMPLNLLIAGIKKKQ